MNHRDLAARLREIFPEERILRDVLLSQYTTFQIGQGLGCSPIKVARELGSERRETVRSLSIVGV